jgi:medium-chain acyl-[acyl-carrier-protein] hydrolase
MAGALLKFHPPSSEGAAVQLRLVCIPHAGGSASLFNGWAGTLGPGFQTVSVQLPGRAERWKEPCYASVAQAVEELVLALDPVLERGRVPFAIFGYSAGATIGFELARALRELGATPFCLFVAAQRAIHLVDPNPLLHPMPEPLFVDEIGRRYEPLPSIVLDDPETRRLFLSVLRADLAMVEKHRSASAAPLPCPISAFGGLADLSVRLEELNAWRTHTSGEFKVRQFPGGHFFLNPSLRPLIDAVRTDLREHLSASLRSPQ